MFFLTAVIHHLLHIQHAVLTVILCASPLLWLVHQRPALSDIEFDASESQTASAGESSPKPCLHQTYGKEVIKDKVQSPSLKERKSKMESVPHTGNNVEEDESLVSESAVCFLWSVGGICFIIYHKIVSDSK